MPIAATTKKNFYKDSVALMRISQTVGVRAGLARVSLLMGTPANKDILGQAGLLAPEIAGAAPADLMILVEGEERALAGALEAIEVELAGGDAKPSAGATEIAPRSIAMGLERLAGATLAQMSVPGPYAAAEALKALKRGLHVFLFSDNVPLAEEQAVKRLAAKKGLLVMGPDCGTAIIAGVPLGFANAVRRGAIGLVGASGTGMQEVTCRVHELGEGISHAIGTGSRDVYDEIGGTTLAAGLELLARDPATRVIVIVSKPPAASVAERALAAVRKAGKPAVVLFLGADLPGGGNVHPVATLEQAATTAVALARGTRPAPANGAAPAGFDAAVAKLGPAQKFLRGLYSGGTYCTEAQLVWRDVGIGTWSNAPLDKRLALPHGAASREHTAIDLGADEFTVGRPHPMIDFCRAPRAPARRRRAIPRWRRSCSTSCSATARTRIRPARSRRRCARRARPPRRTAASSSCSASSAARRRTRSGSQSQRAQLAESGMVLAPGSTAAAALAARAATRT